MHGLSSRPRESADSFVVRTISCILLGYLARCQAVLAGNLKLQYCTPPFWQKSCFLVFAQSGLFGKPYHIVSGFEHGGTVQSIERCTAGEGGGSWRYKQSWTHLEIRRERSCTREGPPKQECAESHFSRVGAPDLQFASQVRCMSEVLIHVQKGSSRIWRMEGQLPSGENNSNLWSLRRLACRKMPLLRVKEL